MTIPSWIQTSTAGPVAIGGLIVIIVGAIVMSYAQKNDRGGLASKARLVVFLGLAVAVAGLLMLLLAHKAGNKGAAGQQAAGNITPGMMPPGGGPMQDPRMMAPGGMPPPGMPPGGGPMQDPRMMAPGGMPPPGMPPPPGGGPMQDPRMMAPGGMPPPPGGGPMQDPRMMGPGMAPTQPLPGNFRYWTSASGARAIAEFVSMDVAAETVDLKNQAGKTFTLKWSELSAADIEYLLSKLEE